MDKTLETRILDAIPHTWLDELLTGPRAVIGRPPYNGHDIERLLSAVKDRVAALLADRGAGGEG